MVVQEDRFSTYVDLIKEWAKEYLNVDIPEPNN